MRIPRMSMLRSMVAIGALGVWIWLTSTRVILVLVGTLVLALTLHAANRRSRMAREIKAEGREPDRLSRAGFYGYSIAIFLGLFWVGCILVWDSHERDRPRRDDPRRIMRDGLDYLASLVSPSPPPPPPTPLPPTPPTFTYPIRSGPLISPGPTVPAAP